MLLAFNWVQVGNLLWKTSGLMIGNLLSKAACSLFFGLCEATSSNSVNWSNIDALRIVDDTLLMSKSVCHDCFRLVASKVYSIPFKQVSTAEKTGDTEWGDMSLSIGKFGGLFIRPKLTNASWIADGDCKRARLRFPPFLDRSQVRFGVLRGIILGVIARSNTIKGSIQVRVSALFACFAELLLVKYPWSYLRALVFSIKRPQDEIWFHVFRRAILRCSKRTITA